MHLKHVKDGDGFKQDIKKLKQPNYTLAVLDDQLKQNLETLMYN